MEDREEETHVPWKERRGRGGWLRGDLNYEEEEGKEEEEEKAKEDLTQEEWQVTKRTRRTPGKQMEEKQEYIKSLLNLFETHKA